MSLTSEEPGSSGADEEVLRFVQSSFRSVWSLELLLLLKRHSRAWTKEELVASLRASELVVTQAIESLVAAGLAAADNDARVTYAPTPRSRELVEATELLYARRPDAVRRAIVSPLPGSLSAFADAFRLRRE